MFVFIFYTTHLPELDFVRSKIVLDVFPGHSGFEDLTK